ncbi:MAG TPA: MarR family winged helix-turn-helix transcriptional regulator [Candidatus Brocadiia bacterium]|nr:hypothetical protein [Planctomycetota bacterium]MDO8091911.1 hypothetical protein [Candidatus Brocadiales bacterium]
MKVNTSTKEGVNLDRLVEEISVLTHEIAKQSRIAPLLNITQEAVLRLLKDNGRLSLKELKALLNLDTYQISRLLTTLESFRNGPPKADEVSLIRREPLGGDKRQWVISLSEEGQKVLEEELKRRTMRLQTMLEPLTEDERNALILILRKMTRSLRQHTFFERK